MWAWLHKLKDYTWNPIVSKIEETFWGRTSAGDAIFNELRQMAPDVRAISLKVKTLGFVWSSDPLGGSLDYHSAPRVTCARKKGDCDDYAYLWKELLLPHGNVWILCTYSTDGRGHAMCVFERGNHFWLLSNLDVWKEASTREELTNCYFGDKTKRSIYL
jgi:predicted transglutaminase-like cysteine proteinase